jgi:hypothetical protein
MTPRWRNRKNSRTDLGFCSCIWLDQHWENEKWVCSCCDHVTGNAWKEIENPIASGSRARGGASSCQPGFGYVLPLPPAPCPVDTSSAPPAGFKFSFIRRSFLLLRRRRKKSLRTGDATGQRSTRGTHRLLAHSTASNHGHGIHAASARLSSGAHVCCAVLVVLRPPATLITASDVFVAASYSYLPVSSALGRQKKSTRTHELRLLGSEASVRASA